MMNDYINSKLLLFAIACTLFLSLGFTLSNYVHVPIEDSKDLFLNGGHFLIVSIGVFSLCYLLSVQKIVFAVVFPLLIFITSIVAFYIYSQNLNFTTSVLDAAIHNDLRTSLDLISFPLITFVFISFGISIGFVLYRLKHVQFKLKWIELVTVLFIALGIYSINQRQNNSFGQRLPFSIYNVSKAYTSQLKNLNQPRKEIGLDAKTNTDSLVFVLVIGEACRADHMQLNGYCRLTNPNLTKQSIVSYSHIYSEWTHTNASLPHFLTRSDSFNHKPATEEKSFISIFKRCGFFTMWISNQEPAPSYISFVKESQVVEYTNPANSVYSFNKKWLDMDNLKYLEKGLSNFQPKKLIIIHTIGSHWWYNDHFTDSNAVFKPILSTKIVSANNKQQMINSYDNTIIATDQFLDKVINQLKTKNAIMVYLSDHGESLGENGKWLHAQDNEPERHPACLIWCSEKYKSKYPDIYKNINENKKNRWRTEFLFSSVLSMADINTSYKNDRLNITKH